MCKRCASSKQDTSKMNELNIELYKQIKEEYRQYGFYIQSLTKMKFIAISSIISFFIVNQVAFDLVKGNMELVSIGVLLIPIVSFFLDLKILEVTLHIRSISKFLSEKYSTTSYISQWENYVWSKNFITLSRTYLTLFSSAGISYIILWASIVLVGKYFLRSWWTYCLIGGIVFTVAGLVFTIIFFRKIWFVQKK